MGAGPAFGRSVPRPAAPRLWHRWGASGLGRLAPVPFTGWPAEAFEFYEGLEADNSKAYWQANKDVYERDVLAPMTSLLAELASEFGEGRIFRPYRDVRFSRDKSPYKTAMGATLALGGYVQVSANGLGAGAGMHSMESDQLERYRAAVAADGSGASLVQLIGVLDRKHIEVSGHDVLKTAPRGFATDHPRIDLLRYKGIIAWKQWAPGPLLGTAKVRRSVAEFFRACEPLTSWLDDHVGPSTLEPGRRA